MHTSRALQKSEPAPKPSFGTCSDPAVIGVQAVTPQTQNMVRMDAEPDPGLTAAAVSITIMPHPSNTILATRFPLNGGLVTLSFDQPKHISRVFPPEVEELLREVTRPDRPSQETHSFPGLQLIGSEVSTTGVSVVPGDAPGSLRVELMALKGNAIGLFRPALFSDQVVQRMIDEAIDDATRHVYLPLRNFGEAIDRALASATTGDLDRLHRQLLAFKTEIEGVCFNFETLLRSDHIAQIDLEKGAPKDRLRVIGIPGT